MGKWILTSYINQGVHDGHEMAIVLAKIVTTLYYHTFLLTSNGLFWTATKGKSIAIIYSGYYMG